MKLKFKFRICNAFWVLVHHETHVWYFQDQHILKGLGNKWKNHSKHLWGVTVWVNHQFYHGAGLPYNLPISDGGPGRQILARASHLSLHNTKISISVPKHIYLWTLTTMEQSATILQSCVCCYTFIVIFRLNWWNEIYLNFKFLR